MTINELMNECSKQMRKGNGNKEIYISRDDEGNGYHFLYYGFCDTEEKMKELDWNEEIENYAKSVILG